MLFSGMVHFCSAQSETISGIVKDGETLLSSSTVSISEQTQLTNADGRFLIKVNPGIYTMIITHVGYIEQRQEIQVYAGVTLELVINMKREELWEVPVKLGSRNLIPRSKLNTNVPVDHLSSKELLATGQSSLIQMLNYTTPSLNVSRQHLTDPVTLRGLSPDHVLILLNGTRYHKTGLNNGGIRGTLGRGSVGNNLYAIPFSAIEKIEILRDGASAQYGSDAIAGVMNIILKKYTGKTAINLHVGQHYLGDGETISFGFNHGIKLNNNGFLSLSGDLHFRNPTQRGGEFQGTVYYNIPANASQAAKDSIRNLDNQKISERGFSRKTPLSNDGSIALTSTGFLVNGAYPVNKKIELSWTGSFSFRQPFNRGLYRFPKNESQVNKLLFPDGFKPIIMVSNWDISGIAGIRGKSNNSWNWDFNSAFGSFSSKGFLRNTNNVSQIQLGANAPTSFYTGASSFTQITNSVDFTREFGQKQNIQKSFMVGFGAEFRLENYQTQAGEEASWKNYDNTGRILQGGIQPSPGTHPRDEVNENRAVAGLYLDLETEIRQRLLLNLASRFENYSDFGGNLASKMAVRYKFSPMFSIRGSASNGYHAPALQQIYYTSTISGHINSGSVNIPVLVGTFSNNSEVAKAFGIRKLAPEKSFNLGAGIISQISGSTLLTIDAYWIKLKNRLVLSERFSKSNPYVNQILLSFPEVDQVQFVTNAISTKTRGIDIVLNSKWKFPQSLIGLTLAANFTSTRVFGPVQTTEKLPADSLNTNTLFDRKERETLESGQPGSKIILSANYQKGKLDFIIRNTSFGKTKAVYNAANKSQDEFFSSKILTDFSVIYKVKSWMSLTAGVNNIFNVYPDPLRVYQNTQEGILVYSNEALQFNYNGGYYFLNMSFQF